jgi:hypothetical protein
MKKEKELKCIVILAIIDFFFHKTMPRRVQRYYERNRQLNIYIVL